MHGRWPRRMMRFELALPLRSPPCRMCLPHKNWLGELGCRGNLTAPRRSARCRVLAGRAGPPQRPRRASPKPALPCVGWAGWAAEATSPRLAEPDLAGRRAGFARCTYVRARVCGHARTCTYVRSYVRVQRARTYNRKRAHAKAPAPSHTLSEPTWPDARALAATDDAIRTRPAAPRPTYRAGRAHRARVGWVSWVAATTSPHLAEAHVAGCWLGGLGRRSDLAAPRRRRPCQKLAGRAGLPKRPRRASPEDLCRTPGPRRRWNTAHACTRSHASSAATSEHASPHAHYVCSYIHT
jgi:hypothetical protein